MPKSKAFRPVINCCTGARRAAVAMIVALSTLVGSVLPAVASPPGHLLRVGILEAFAEVDPEFGTG